VVRADIARSLAGRVSSRRSYNFVDNLVDRIVPVIDDDGYHTLREAIASGELLPSERLVEEDLSRRLGIGRAAVRMALVRLEHDGLVERERNRGARVRRVTEAEAVEILEVRAALESLAARHAALRATPADVRELRALLREMGTRRERGDLMAVSETNARLHRRILEISGHGTATRLSGMLISQIVRFQYRTVLLPGRPERSHREHVAIVDAIAAGDGDGAERAMRRHLDNVASALRERVAAGAAPTAARRGG
jgi:DNA-binding GntR family transcriptional regulator